MSMPHSNNSGLSGGMKTRFLLLQGWWRVFHTGLRLVALLLVSASPCFSALRTENFDYEPPNWDGMNNRNQFIESKTVSQDFGYSPATSHAGGRPGEIGGRINPAAEPAWFGFALPKPLTLDSPMKAEGRLNVAPGPGHF